ncbi:hypothetical protein BDW74DRAFT_179558 [Aspergillus multicolor]|uniref:uncharacterized protein n=1 Tax=Aspergillus multicolor TaxID=41759 RepID=UPI003CCCB665
MDASYFLQARDLSWKWSCLTSLALTSRLLVPDEERVELDGILLAAAEAAMKMSKLRTMELWNGRKGLTMFFRYQATEREQSVVITFVQELLDAGVVMSHSDAIAHLELRKRREPVTLPDLLNLALSRPSPLPPPPLDFPSSASVLVSLGEVVDVALALALVVSVVVAVTVVVDDVCVSVSN